MCLIVFCRDYVWLQVVSQTFLGVFVLIFFGYSEPYELPIDGKKVFFDEMMIMLCVYHCFLFTDFVDDAEARFLVGYSFIGCILVNVSFHFYFVV